MKQSFCLCEILRRKREHVRKPWGVSNTKYPCPVLICNLHNYKMTKPKLSPINTAASEAENQYISPQPWCCDHISDDIFCSLSLVFVSEVASHYRVTPPDIDTHDVTPHHTSHPCHESRDSIVTQWEQVTGMTLDGTTQI